MSRAPGGRAGDIRVGIAGWTFPPWRGAFYPKGLKQKEELAYAARQFRTLEINGTFYALQRPKTFASWAEETPEDFVFSMKAPRFITHMKRLKDCAAPIANFLASGVLRLGPKLGPILWQLPANFAFDAERIAAWCALLPHDTAAAADMARGHEARLNGRVHLETDAKRPLRHALEARHASFADPAALALLRKHDVAVVISDGTQDWPHFRELTAGFAYVRLHLSPELGPHGYGREALQEWAGQAAQWAGGGEVAGRDVFLYCDAAGDESVKINTPANATTLAECVRRLAEG